MRRSGAALIIGTAAHLLSGCSVLGYYKQGLVGQLDLMRRTQPIEQVLTDAGTDPKTRQRLRLVLDLRRFAITELQLPDNGSYLHYADLQRPFVVWNVFATPEFSLRPVQSCFPVVGCLNYRGYFVEDDALRAARQLAAEGHDVFVGGVAAYSTLGWFADPVVSSMLNWDELRLGRLIFHELAHQQLYADDDSDFNEAFATAVGIIGIERWLAVHDDVQMRADWTRFRQRQKDFVALVGQTAARLKRLYAIQADPQAMRQAKADVLSNMQREYRALRDGPWGGYDGYDQWFDTVNNARIAAVATYHDLVPGFLAHYRQLGEDMPAFYDSCAQAAQWSSSRRREWLQAATAAPN